MIYMKTRIIKADVKFNPRDNYCKCIVIENNAGVLIVEPELFVISFKDMQDAKNQNVSIINRYLEKQIEL